MRTFASYEAYARMGAVRSGVRRPGSFDVQPGNPNRRGPFDSGLHPLPGPRHDYPRAKRDRAGHRIGEAFSAESKYQWRSVVCDEEWNEIPKDRCRTKWKKGNNGAYVVRQVRAEMEDLVNTVLKVAKKPAQIDTVLTVTAASDIFAQDLENLIEGGMDPAEHEGQKPQLQNCPAELQRKAMAQRQRSGSSPARVSIPRQSRGPYGVSRSKGLERGR